MHDRFIPVMHKASSHKSVLTFFGHLFIFTSSFKYDPIEIIVQTPGGNAVLDHTYRARRGA